MDKFNHMQAEFFSKTLEEAKQKYDDYRKDSYFRTWLYEEVQE